MLKIFYSVSQVVEDDGSYHEAQDQEELTHVTQVFSLTHQIPLDFIDLIFSLRSFRTIQKNDWFVRTCVTMVDPV